MKSGCYFPETKGFLAGVHGAPGKIDKLSGRILKSGLIVYWKVIVKMKFRWKRFGPLWKPLPSSWRDRKGPVKIACSSNYKLLNQCKHQVCFVNHCNSCLVCLKSNSEPQIHVPTSNLPNNATRSRKITTFSRS